MNVLRRRRLPFEAASGCYALDSFLGAWCYLLTGEATLLVDTGIPGRAKTSCERRRLLALRRLGSTRSS